MFMAALALASPAVARQNANSRIDRLERKVDRLEAKADRFQRRARQANRQLATKQAQVGALTAERDDARTALAAMTRERDQANSTATAMRDQIAAEPTPLQVAVTHVDREVQYSERLLQQAGASYSREALIAHAAMSYVVGHVSAPAYGWMNEIDGSGLMPTANAVLAAGAGVCGHAALTFAAIVKRFGLEVRSVQFYYDTSSHIANEVYYDGAWHFYDPTYGAYYTDDDHVLSMEDARSHPDPKSLLKFNRALLWYEVAVLAGFESSTDLEATLDPETLVEYDKQPFVD